MKQAEFEKMAEGKLLQKYGKDELVALLKKQSREKSIIIGQLESEILHLKSEIKRISRTPRNQASQEALIQLRKDKFYNNLKLKIKEQAKQIKAQKYKFDELLLRYQESNAHRPAK